MQATLRLGHIMCLSWALALARFKLRIAGRYLGIFWYVLEPLAFFIILLSLQVNVGAGSIPHYSAYLLLGLIMTNFFIGTTGSGKSTLLKILAGLHASDVGAAQVTKEYTETYDH
jgi:ABC-type polysaccharide/polyol phosphate export permease